jgi:hypothetical protein
LQLRLRLHPACHVLFSGYPLARIWQVHQEACGGEVEVDFSRGTGSVLVYRPRYRVEVAAIAGAEAAFFAAVRGGQALETAVHAARSRDASFDLGRLLKEWIESSVIVGFNCIGG